MMMEKKGMRQSVETERLKERVGVESKKVDGEEIHSSAP